ncbi:MAG: RNA polymerase sigma factor RpoH [Rickettsiaceae bacterium]|nr:RNA polymerase sigma factor RpoH [Rickettsiaceae bacterium]
MANLSVKNFDNGFGAYLEEINRIPSLTLEEEFLYAKDYLEKKDLEAAHKLVKSHLKLVVKIAMRYRSYGLPMSDLVAEGNIGLMQAVKKFDPKLEFRLSTYATWWIKAAIQEYVLRSWSLVRLGTTAAQKKLFFSLNKVKNRISNIYGREVRTEDFVQIASALGVSEKEVKEMNQRLAGSDFSLNVPVLMEEGNRNTEMLNLLPAKQSSQEDILSQRQISYNKNHVLSSALSTLNDREAKILIARKLQDEPVTLDVLSNQYKISKERIRQIENKAFAKIQSYVLKYCSSDGQLLT